MYNRLIDHITSHSILANEQFGFRTSHSTQQATFLLINNILTAYLLTYSMEQSPSWEANQ